MRKVNSVFTGRNEVVAKVMFLLVCVILFTRGGGLPQCSGKEAPPGKEAPHPREGSTPLPHTAYGQWAVGTHPTGMHSCLLHVCFCLYV